VGVYRQEPLLWRMLHHPPPRPLPPRARAVEEGSEEHRSVPKREALEVELLKYQKTSPLAGMRTGAGVFNRRSVVAAKGRPR